MKIQISVFLSILTFCSITVLAQAPDTLWTRTYGSETDNDFGASLLLLPDGGCLIAGTTYMPGAVNSDIYLLRTDSDGDTLWTKTYGGYAEEYGFSLLEINGGIVIAGETYSFGAGDADCYLVRTSALGDTFWTRAYGGEERDAFHDVVNVPMGYIAVGETWSFGAGLYDVYIVATLFGGDTLWTKTYGGEASDQAYSVVVTDSGFTIVGETSSFSGNNNPDVYLLVLNADGDTLWTKTYGGAETDIGQKIILMADGGYLIGGSTTSFGAGLNDFYLIRTDENGDTLWTRTYGDSQDQMLYGLDPATDGGFILAGLTALSSGQPSDAYFVKVDSAGNEIWNTAIEIEGYESISDVAALPDYGYISVGTIGDEITDSADLYLMRLEGDPGRLFGNQKGILTAGTYIIAGETFVDFDDSLIVEPGVTFLTEGDFDIRVNGYFTAIGTESDSIYFLPADGFDQWGGLVFQDSALNECEIAYCYFTGGSIGAVNMYHTNMTISHSTMENNSANWGGGIYVSYSDAYIHDCIVNGNISYNNGGGIYVTHSAPTIENCLIFDNHCDGPGSGFGGGGVCFNHGSPGQLIGCTVYGNDSGVNGGGVSINDNSNVEVINCTISGNSTLELGGGIFSGWTEPIIRNTIVEGNSGAGGVFFYRPDDMVLEYCNIFDNDSAAFLGDTIPAGLGEIAYVNLNGDSCDAFFNIFLDPVFLDPQNGDFNLSEDSPCIDAGDPESPLDPDSTIADIGSYFYNQGMWIEKPGQVNEQPGEFKLYGAYPNPFNQRTAISYQLLAYSHVNLMIFDVNGREIARLVDGYKNAGHHELIFDAEGLASGLYFVRLQACDYKQTQKVILIK